MNQTHIDVLRHGQCEGGRIYRGSSTDVALTREGLQCMHAAASAASDTYDVVISSPLKRCRSFSEEYANTHHCVLEVRDDVREFYFGDWEGCLIDNIWEQNAELAEAWYHNPEHHYPPNSEPFSEFNTRIFNAFKGIAHDHKNKTVLLVTHAGVVRSLMHSILHLPPHALHQIDVPYGCVSRFTAGFHESNMYLKLARHNFVTSLETLS